MKTEGWLGESETVFSCERSSISGYDNPFKLVNIGKADDEEITEETAGVMLTKGLVFLDVVMVTEVLVGEKLLEWGGLPGTECPNLCPRPTSQFFFLQFHS